mmetsp:Transcript_17421/g.41468  ORF Transcript_17421/g.41468 Transcript_17421/m.41468 type:complete len:220 (+) Transcript_17421:43-702(+)|eukprot:CAMPEP_0117029922 /NCGR_PEP_ID=MMETSP0472-20121206/21622_1 /TAXON_ID=693140 ORGANISM="Tiarina fusus, Strain LIS" /NCGR_SAMPLE_ID=MMETSP0472 /ASSEMBLY_ACC=CAM_ASM_000603 /LENGTH=219 /DNA_ID=CAMNT_0004737815 /DNA_START=6 /DNA_END=665 /DNA_ORIENTATION=-
MAYQPPYGAPPSGAYGQPAGQYGSQPPAQTPWPPASQPQQAYASGPPPGADPRLWQFFSAVDKDNSGRIDSHELQQALSNGTWSPFNLDTVNLLIKMFDKSGGGEIGFQDFCSLWKYINDWKTCFQQADGDGNGYINSSELQRTLSSFGYSLSPQFYPFMLQRFGKKDKGNMIYFDDFINLNAMLRSLTDSFRQYDTQRTGHISVSYEQFLHMVMSATR